MQTNTKIKPLPIAKKWLVLLNGIGIAMIIGAFSLRTNGQNGIQYLYIGLALSGIAFFTVVRDLIINPFKNKLTWAFFLTVFTFLASFVYLIFRDSIITKEE